MVKFKPKYGLICDEIRTEDNGKRILIGVYTGHILVADFPALLSLCALLSFEIEGDKGEHVDMETRLIVRHDDQTLDDFQVKAKFSLDFDGSEQTVRVDAPSEKALMTINDIATLYVEIKRKGGKWKELVRKRVLKKSGVSS